MFTFFADVKQDLGVLSVVTEIPHSVSCPVLSLVVNKTALEFKTGDEDDSKRLCKFTLHGISILPKSCHRLLMNAERSLHLRFQLNEKDQMASQNAPHCQSSGASGLLNSWSEQAGAALNTLSRKSYVVLCRMCASPIATNKQFNRVLLCPSDDWFEFSESWWCHRHGHNHDAIDDPNHDQTKLQVDASDVEPINDHILHISRCDDHENSETEECHRTCGLLINEDTDHYHHADSNINNGHSDNGCKNKSHELERISDQHSVENIQSKISVNDCLISDTYLTLDQSYLLPESYIVTEKKRIQCARCRCHLGQYLKTDTDSQSSQFLEPSQKFLQLMLHLLIISPNPSVVVQPFNAKQLEIELSSFLIKERQSANNFRFIVEMRNEDNRLVPVVALWVLDVRALLYTASLTLGEEECSIHPVPVIKLLYKDCLREKNKSTGSAWYCDLTVQSIELPEFFCLSILQRLVDSTKRLPRSVRLVNDFYVGYLQREDEICNN